MQILVPLQHGMSSMVAGDGELSRVPNVTLDDQLNRKMAAQQHQIAALHMRVRQLEKANEKLTGIRNLGFDSGRLIPAKIVAGDSLSWRDARLVDRGTLRGVRTGSVVLSAYFVNIGEKEEVEDGMMVLAGETLVGQVVRVSTHTAQLLLVTDPASRPRLVQIIHLGDDQESYIPEGSAFFLHGLGNGRMEIKDVDQDFIRRREIQPNDLVVLAETNSQLPLPVVVGRIKDIRQDDNNRVLYRLIVEPECDLKKIRSVYIVDNQPT